MDTEKKAVHDFWNSASCGEKLYLDSSSYDEQSRMRYVLEPYIADFAEFSTMNNKMVLEIGVGLGADHQRFAEAGAELFGVDLTSRAIEHVRERLESRGLTSCLAVGDAERLHYTDDSFDAVYSWGVLHHSPDTPKAIEEVRRVLKPGGTARIMIYHKYSLVGAMLWLRYAVGRFRPWLSLATIYATRLESPGTKAYTISEAKLLFAKFNDVQVCTVLTHGDLLDSAAGQRHQGLIISAARRVWPRAILKKWCSRWGLFMMIRATK